MEKTRDSNQSLTKIELKEELKIFRADLLKDLKLSMDNLFERLSADIGLLTEHVYFIGQKIDRISTKVDSINQKLDRKQR